MKRIYKAILFFTIFTIFLQLLSVNVFASRDYPTTDPQLSEFYFLSITSSPDEHSDGNTRSETFSYSDPYAIGLYDGKFEAKMKHHRGKFVIRYQQRGYTDSMVFTVDGKRMGTGMYYDHEDGYIKETGRVGLVAWKNEITVYNIDDTVEESEITLTATVNNNTALFNRKHIPIEPI